MRSGWRVVYGACSHREDQTGDDATSKPSLMSDFSADFDDAISLMEAAAAPARQPASPAAAAAADRE